METCLVLVTYNRYKILLDTINVIFQQVHAPKYFVIVDNFSSDNTVEKLYELQDSRFEVVQLNDNLGYGAAATVGMKYAESKYDDIGFFWIMDDDSRPAPDTLQTMVAAYARSSQTDRIGVMGLMGFKLKFGGYTEVTKASGLPLLNQNPSLIDVDFVLMDGSLIKINVVRECGFYRDDFFMMGEDYEYCKRVLSHHFKIALLVDGNAAMQRLILGGGEKFSRSSIWRGYYQARNHVHILRSFFSIKDCLSYLLRQSKFIIYSLKSPDRFERIYYRTLGIFHGLMGVKGRTIDPTKFMSKKSRRLSN